jgi:hypothetical protein
MSRFTCGEIASLSSHFIRNDNKAVNLGDGGLVGDLMSKRNNDP